MKNYQTIVLLCLLFFVIFSFQALGQTLKEKQDKIEITKLADAFLEKFIETQDLEKIPPIFFDNKFRTRFVRDSDLVIFREENYTLSEQAFFKRTMAFHNFSNLLILVTTSCSETDSYEDLTEFERYKKCLPADIYNKIKASKWLKMFVGEETEQEPKNSSESDELFAEMNEISDTLRIYLTNNPPQKSKDFQKVKDKYFKFHPANICEKEECLGFPNKTSIFEVHQLGMCLRIVKLKGQWKIVQIYSVVTES